MPTVPKWLIETKDITVKDDGQIYKVLRETEKAVLAVVKYPIGDGKESSKVMWVPKSQIDKVKDTLNEIGEMEFTHDPYGSE